MLIPSVCTSAIPSSLSIDNTGAVGVSRHLSKGRDGHEKLQSSKKVDDLVLFPGQV